ncbi:hypothetical protein ES288_D09G162400v1 [Gossypium darwinii]|uniref:Transmembrane protein n=1 Tax=Gossypium darwinii TaxID=34276 RepID=A0A5D2B9T7_GOSDA|nr:hypothetical protein ES288_D09G162400v1 [Gossypium darwinii]
MGSLGSTTGFYLAFSFRPRFGQCNFLKTTRTTMPFARLRHTGDGASNCELPPVCLLGFGNFLGLVFLGILMVFFVKLIFFKLMGSIFVGILSSMIFFILFWFYYFG